MTETTATAPDATPDTPSPAPAATDKPRAPMSFDDALAAMQKARETAKAAPREEAAEDGESDPEPTTDEDRDGDGVEPEQEDAEDEPEASDEDDKDDDEQQDDDPVVKLDDDTEVKLSELIKGYQRQADYTRKTQALAEQRKATEGLVKELTDARSEYHQRAERYGALVESLEKIVEQDKDEWAKVDWDALKEDDPHEYLLKRDEYQRWQEQQRAIKAEKERLSAEQRKEQEKAFKEAQDALRADLMQRFPRWSDNTVLQADTQRMAETARALGFTEEEMSMTLDPRAWQLLWEAAEYRRIKAGQRGAKSGDAKPKAQEADEPRPVRVLRASGSRPSPRTTATAQVKALTERAKQTRSFEDAFLAYQANRRRSA